MAEVTQKIIKEVYKKRPSEVHKYDHGLLLVIGGSKFYSGSPALSALAAFRAGVDMIQIIAPKRAADIVASFSPNLAAYPLEGDYLKKEHLATLISMTKSAEIVSHKKIAVVIGGGVGRSEETKEVICEYLSQISVPAVIDADAIKIVGKNHLKFKVRQGRTVMDAIGFGMAESLELLYSQKHLEMAFILAENEWQGRKTIQLELKDIRVMN